MAAYSYRKYRYRPRGKSGGGELAVAVAVVAVVAAASGSHSPAVRHGVTEAAAGIGAPSGGALSCAGLEALWESVGGSRSAAFMAAEIAQAESSGQQYAANQNTNGTVDRGYWQINSTWGALSTFDAAGNARAAVRISRDGTDWWPWVTYQIGAYQGKC